MKYDGRTKAEYESIIAKLEAKRHYHIAGDRAEAEKEERRRIRTGVRKQRAEDAERKKLQKEFIEVTRNIPVERLRLLIKDTKIRLKLDAKHVMNVKKRPLSIDAIHAYRCFYNFSSILRSRII